MEVVAGGVAGRADVADDLTGGDRLADGDAVVALVAVPDLGAVLEGDDRPVTVRPAPGGRGDRAAGDRVDRGAVGGREVQTRVGAGPVAAGRAEGAGDVVDARRDGELPHVRLEELVLLVGLDVDALERLLAGARRGVGLGALVVAGDGRGAVTDDHHVAVATERGGADEAYVIGGDHRRAAGQRDATDGGGEGGGTSGQRDRGTATGCRGGGTAGARPGGAADADHRARGLDRRELVQLGPVGRDLADARQVDAAGLGAEVGLGIVVLVVGLVGLRLLVVGSVDGVGLGREVDRHRVEVDLLRQRHRRGRERGGVDLERRRRRVERLLEPAGLLDLRLVGRRRRGHRRRRDLAGLAHGTDLAGQRRERVGHPQRLGGVRRLGRLEARLGRDRCHRLGKHRRGSGRNNRGGRNTARRRLGRDRLVCRRLHRRGLGRLGEEQGELGGRHAADAEVLEHLGGHLVRVDAHRGEQVGQDRVDLGRAALDRHDRPGRSRRRERGREGWAVALDESAQLTGRDAAVEGLVVAGGPDDRHLAGLLEDHAVGPGLGHRLFGSLWGGGWCRGPDGGGRRGASLPDVGGRSGRSRSGPGSRAVGRRRCAPLPDVAVARGCSGGRGDRTRTVTGDVGSVVAHQFISPLLGVQTASHDCNGPEGTVKKCGTPVSLISPSTTAESVADLRISARFETRLQNLRVTGNACLRPICASMRYRNGSIPG